MITIPQVLIFQHPISTSQSGFFKKNLWYIKFINYATVDEKYIFDLMNWVGGKDTLKTIKIPFESKERAINYAKAKGFIFKEEPAEVRKIKPKSYTTNFL